MVQIMIASPSTLSVPRNIPKCLPSVVLFKPPSVPMCPPSLPPLRNLMLREVKKLTQGHRGSKWLRQAGLHPRIKATGPTLMPIQSSIKRQPHSLFYITQRQTIQKRQRIKFLGKIFNQDLPRPPLTSYKPRTDSLPGAGT